MKSILKKLLTTTFISAIVVSAFVALVLSVVHRVNTFNREGAELTRQIFEVKQQLAEAKKWKSQSQWVGESVPRLESRSVASDRLVKKVEALQKRFPELIIDEVRFGSAAEMFAGETEGHFDKSSVEFLMRGSEEKIIHLIHSLQQPDNFTSIDQIAIEASDKGRLLCEIRASQWFQPNDRIRIPFPSLVDSR